MIDYFKVAEVGKDPELNNKEFTRKMLCRRRQSRPARVATSNQLTVSVLFLRRNASLRRKNSLKRGPSFKRLSLKRKEAKVNDEQQFLPNNDLTSFLEIKPPKNGNFSAQISLKTFGDASKIIINVFGSRLEILKVSSGLKSKLNRKLRKHKVQNTVEQPADIRKRVFQKRFGEKESFIRRHSTVKNPEDHHAKMNGPGKTTSCGYIILPTYIDPETLEFFIDGQEEFNVRARIKGALPCTKPESPKPTKRQMIKSLSRRMFSCISARPQDEYRSRVCSSARQFLSQKLSRNLASGITVPLSLHKSNFGMKCDSLLDLTFPVRYQGTVTVKGVFRPNNPTSGGDKEVTPKGKFLSCTWVLGKS